MSKTFLVVSAVDDALAALESALSDVKPFHPTLRDALAAHLHGRVFELPRRTTFTVTRGVSVEAYEARDSERGNVPVFKSVTIYGTMTFNDRTDEYARVIITGPTSAYTTSLGWTSPMPDGARKRVAEAVIAEVPKQFLLRTDKLAAEALAEAKWLDIQRDIDGATRCLDSARLLVGKFVAEVQAPNPRKTNNK